MIVGRHSIQSFTQVRIFPETGVDIRVSNRDECARRPTRSDYIHEK